MEMKVGVVSAWPEAEKAYGHFADETDCVLYFRFGLLDQAAELVSELRKDNNVDAIITLGIPMDIFDHEVHSIIYPIYPSNYDILHALYKSMDMGKRPAFAEISFHSILYDFETICNILHADIARYRFSSLTDHTHRESVERVVQEIQEDKRDVLVTMGGYSCQVAKESGLLCIPVMPDSQSFKATLESVRRSFLTRQVEVEKTKWLNAVFDNAKEGVMVLDRYNKVVAINSSAQKFMHLKADEIIGRSIEDVHSTNPLFQQFLHANSNLEIFNSRTRSYVVNRDVLYAAEVPLGTVIRANPVKELQKLEMSARRKISESGFTAAATFADIKGSSKIFEDVKRKARSYANALSSIILYGESGSGKELFAQSIHNASLCADGPFVAINCTVLTENLLESELFGYEDGAFTGARKGGKPGLFELAHKGTLFLDEIGDMPLSIQVKLLRVLQERMVRRIGGSKNIPVDVRLIFATHQDLKADISEGRFRKDLYYRINVLVLQIPPLRDHKSDLIEISQDILKRLSKRTKKLIVLSDKSYRIMQSYDWPGNVRELNNFLERASFLDLDNDKIILDMVNDLADSGNEPHIQEVLAENDKLTIDLDTMHNIENAIIKTLYQTNGWSRKEIESVLGISTSSLYRRLKELNLLEAYM